MLNNLIRFVANTKAKASEVNYNFDQVKAKIQELDDWKTSTDDRLNKYSSFQLFDIIAVDRVLTGEEAKGKLLQGSLVTNLYPDAVAKIKDEWDNGAEQTYTYSEDISFPYRLAANRHMIVDILYKDDVDALFTATGVAWFYIWDKDNEQFYLPRSLWFDQYTNNVENVSKYNEPALPDHNHSVTVATYYGGGGAGYQQFNNPSGGVTGNASASNPIYKQGVNTVQPPSSNKLLYFVVGNTYVNQEEIDLAKLETNKLDVSLSNATQTTKAMITAQVVPDYKNGKQGETNYEVWKTVDRDVKVSVTIINKSNAQGLIVNAKDPEGNYIPTPTSEPNRGDIAMFSNYSYSASLGFSNIVSFIIPKGYSYKFMQAVGNPSIVGCIEYPLKGVSE